MLGSDQNLPRGDRRDRRARRAGYVRIPPGAPQGTVRPMAEERDPTRRTLLANERTFLAWWRGALTALAVSLGAGALVPELTTADRWPFVSLGVGFGVLAIVFILYGSYRHRAVEDALQRGEFAPVHRGVVLAFAVVGVTLGLLTILAVLVQL